MKPPKRKVSHLVATAAVGLLVACLLFASGPGSASGVQACPGGGAVVSGASARDFEDICEGVASSLSFFASHDFPATEALSVEVAERLPEEAGSTAAGCYLESKRRIYVVPFSAFRKNKTWFGVSIDRAMYRSLASHEAAHAVAACRFLVPNPTIQAKEYLAYVAMFSSMPAATRKKALAGLPTEPFVSFDRFTPMLYMFDPMRFGAEAYRHFSSLPFPASVVRDVLTGKVLND